MRIPPTIKIIGLPESYRGVELESQLKNLGFEFCRHAGVKGYFRGQPVPKFYDEEGALSIYGHELTVSEVGCALAHYSAASDQSVDSEWLLVVEDDSRVAEPELFTEVLEVLGGIDTSSPRVIMLYARAALLGDTLFRSSESSLKITELLVEPTSGVAYIANKAARVLLSEAALPIVSPSDFPYRASGQINYSVVTPFPVRPSTTEISEVGDRSKLSSVTQVKRAAAYISHTSWLQQRESGMSYRSYVARATTWLTWRILLLTKKYKTDDGTHLAHAPRVLHSVIRWLMSRPGNSSLGI